MGWWTRDPAEWAAIRDTQRLLGEPRLVWERFAYERGFSCVVRPGGTCGLTCRIGGQVVTVISDGDHAHGFDTEARASSPLAMRGTVLVRPSGDLELLRRSMFGRPRLCLGVDALDTILSVRASSEVLARAVLDAKTMSFLHAVVGRPLRMLRYSDGAIAIRWAGVERNLVLLLEAIELVAHLAVTGTDVAPYR